MNNYQLRRLCAWSGMLSVILFFLGFILAHFIPPPSPSLTMLEVAAHYQEHTTSIRIGMIVLMVSGMFMAPMVGEISAQMKRIPNLPTALRYAQISTGTTNTMFFLIPPLMFAATAFRPDRAPEITYMLNDLAWIMAVLPWSPAFMQSIIIAIAIFRDKGATPVFPRWLAFLNIWVAIAYIPGALLVFFHQGPFAWSGIFVFWLAGAMFTIWFIAMTVCLIKAINHQEKLEE